MKDEVQHKESKKHGRDTAEVYRAKVEKVKTPAPCTVSRAPEDLLMDLSSSRKEEAPRQVATGPTSSMQDNA